MSEKPAPNPDTASSEKSPPLKISGFPPFYAEADEENPAAEEPWHPQDPHQYLRWDSLAPGPAWAPYVIYCESFNEPFLEFRFQKEKGWGDTIHTIDVSERRLVWSGHPSTLHHEKGAINKGEAAFLFLTDKLETLAPALWKDGHKPINPPPRKETQTDTKHRSDRDPTYPGTGGGGKWPIRAGDGIHVQRVLRWMEGLSEEQQALVRKALQIGGVHLE